SRWRRGHRLRAGLPDGGHRLRRRERSRGAGLAPPRRPAHLRGAERAQHAAAHPLSRPHRQRQPGALRAMTTHAEARLPRMQSDAELTDRLVAPVGPGKRWLMRGLLVSGAITALFALAMTYTFLTGIGTWGNDIPVGWAFGITNFVWWIGIGHAG